MDRSPYHHMLGVKGAPDSVVYKTGMEPEDRILLCTDGVNAHLNDQEIEQIVAADWTPDQICRQLIQTANERVGNDNITAVVAIANPASESQEAAG